MRSRRAIDAGERAEIAGEGRHADLQIGADGGDDLGAEAQEHAVFVERQLGLGDVVARLRVAQERLRTRRHPFHRPADELGAKQHQGDLVIDRRLHAEAAADVAAHHADLVVGDFQHELRQLGLEHIGPLQRGVDGVAALGRLVEADGAARLHGRRGDAVDDELVLDHMRGARKRRVGRLLVTLDLDEADIVRAILPNQRHAGIDRVAGRDHGRQRLVIDLDQFGGVDRLEIGLGDDEGDIVADHPHPVLDQRRIARPVAGNIVAALQAAGHRQITKARRLVVGAGEHREHARRGFGFRRVDFADAGMGMRRAQHEAVRHAGKRHVGDIAAMAFDQPRILEAGNGLADRVFTHRSPHIPGGAS